MNIWTEELVERHLPLLEAWAGRSDGAITPNDLPASAEGLAQWFERRGAEPGRLDCLALVYETPVGLAGLRRSAEGEAELYLLLCERGYNPLRTATYICLRMLDRAFLDLGLERVTMRVLPDGTWFLEALARMGFSPTEERDGPGCLAVERDTFQNQKYLF
ncbi:MAG: hypothetical protein IJ179_09645 [Oscillospiraceae bacterium]|nr:hypothetical protein [Oscillospiraceae bacterium]